MSEFPTSSNRHVIQSYLLSCARSRFNITQMRILYRLVEFAQSELDGLLIKENMCKIEHNLRNVEITIPARSVLSENSKHYEQVREALFSMLSSKVQFYDAQEGIWKASTIICNPRIISREGVVSFEVADWVWDSMLNFTKGYRKYELQTVLKLKSANSMKMYTLISGNERPIEYTFDYLKGFFGVAGKYKQNSDFVKKILKPVQRELNAVCPYTFDFVLIKEGRRIDKVMIAPRLQKDKRDQDLVNRAMLSKASFGLFFSNVNTYLRHNMDFSAKEIKANQQLFEDCAKELPDIMSLLASIQSRRRTASGEIKGKGWVISALRAELNIARSSIR